MAFTAADLETDLQALEDKLETKKDEADDLNKALADVAKGAIHLADKTLEKSKGTATKEDKAETDEEDTDDEASDDEDTQDFIERLVDKKKAATLHKSQKTTPARKTGLQKALETDTPVLVNEYLQQELALRETDREHLAALAKSHEQMQETLTAVVTLLTQDRKKQSRIQSVFAKSLMKLLEDAHTEKETILAQVPESKFARMEKSLKAAGGQSVPYDKGLAWKMLQAKKIDADQMSIWKHTNMLPAGVDL